MSATNGSAADNTSSKQKDENDDDLVEIRWSGDVIVLPRSKVDNWFHGKSFEAKCDYVKKHPEIVRSGKQKGGSTRTSGGSSSKALLTGQVRTRRHVHGTKVSGRKKTNCFRRNVVGTGGAALLWSLFGHHMLRERNGLKFSSKRDSKEKRIFFVYDICCVDVFFCWFASRRLMIVTAENDIDQIRSSR